MKKIFLLLCFLSLAFIANAQTPTFTFECFCGYLSPADTNCDICSATIQSRFFKGILIRKDGVVYKWIEEPYTVRFSGDVATFLELIPTPEQIRINRLETPYGTLDSFKNAIACPCAGGLAAIEVDTPIIGDGSPGNPITIGQFGADTTMYLNWNGQYWYPDKIDLSDLIVDLPYFVDDDAALAAGLMPGEPYLLECANTYNLPAGLYKVIKICGFDCSFVLRYYVNDAAAEAGGIPVGNQYLVDESNPYGIFNGFVKLVTGDSLLPSGTLVCNDTVSYFINDFAALTGGLFLGDLYGMASANTYGAPEGMERAVSAFSSTSADVPNCCSNEDRLAFYANDAAAITGGLSAGDWYYLSNANTYGYPYGTKKQTQ